ncbi:MAG: two-component system response regulator [Planctomyces sp.]|nr:two-component system response regulator [Planctomyces sp.]
MKIIETGRPAEVLLVEDNENDVILTRRGFESARFTVNLHHVENGVQCLQFLRKEGAFKDAPSPDLILLDLNMPIMDGREVLAAIVKDEELCKFPVVILTTSAEEQDILDTYKLRCSSYIVKPVDFRQFQRVVEELGNYWFTIVILPSEE